MSVSRDSIKRRIEVLEKQLCIEARTVLFTMKPMTEAQLSELPPNVTVFSWLPPLEPRSSNTW